MHPDYFILVQNFNELMDLCAKGNASNVSVTNRSLMERMEGKKTDENDIYGAWAETIDDVPDNVVFSFGQADGKTLGKCFRNNHLYCRIVSCI